MSDFDIFLSFRGEDTRNGFTGHLHHALCSRLRLNTFIDNLDLKKGEKIEELFGYIERSKVFVPIISKGYADSRWCLKEIAKIVECVECAHGKLILPIFFGVEPSDIRNQSGPFERAFKSYDKEMDEAEVKKWRDALKEVTTRSGYSLEKDANWHEATLVNMVADHLQRHLDSGLLYVADHPVGLDTRVEDVMKLLQIGGDGVKKVGIVGTGGIGKTTIAKAVFNKLRLDFGSSTFLANIRESSQIEQLRQYAKDILNDEVTPIHNIDVGRRLVNEKVSGRVLIVLDDADDHANQFQELKPNDLPPGSRIIITTRDERVLLGYGVEQEDMYRPNLLDADQSSSLFKRYAFQNTPQPHDKYSNTLEDIVACAGGLPLALKVFGSNLCGISDLVEWQDYLKKLQSTSNQEIQKRLQISYDGLSCEAAKRIFLDIACFYVGHFRYEATLLWENLSWQPESAIKELQRKSLISGGDEQFEMHDLLRDMARHVVRQVDLYKPWKWSRLWKREDIIDMLRKNRRKIEENEDIESICLYGTGEQCLSTEAFGNMTSLKVLRVSDVTFEGENFFLPEDLKILFLRLSKFKSLSSCNFENLIALELDVANDMSELLVKESASKQFNALKVLKISCHKIKATPDFSNMPHLETLVFFYCASLSEVHESIGRLTRLQYLRFLQCLNLEKLPDAICQLTSLQTLRIKQFPRLESLPERLGNLESLNMLELDDLAITSIPSSIGQLTKLSEMYLRKLDRLDSLPDSISGLNSLRVFNVEGTDLKGMKIDGGDLIDIDRLEISSCNWLSVLPASSLKKVRVLCISDSRIKELPESIKAMDKIEELSLRCKNLMTLPDWLPYRETLKTFEADCESITPIINEIFSLRSIESLSLCCADEKLPAAMAETSVENLKSFTLRCKNLKALPEWIGSLENLKFLKFEACESITELPLCIRNLSRLEELSLNGCKRIRLVPLLPSSLLILDASNCSDLEKTPDISNLKSLKKLRLGGCRLLEDVQGIENAAQNMEELVLPGPYGSIGCSSLSDDFKKQVFKELAFERLRRFEIWGSLSPVSLIGHQQLCFMFPNRANGLKPELMMKRLVLNKVQSPIRIQVLESDHRVVFESTLEVQRPIVKNFFRPIWIPLPRVSNCQIRYRGRLVIERLQIRYRDRPVIDMLGGVICVPCHGRCAMLSRNAIGGSEVVEVEELAAEDGHEDGGGRDNETEADEEADREPKVFINVQQEVAKDGRKNSGSRDGTETEADKVEVQRECEVLNEVEEEAAEDDREEGGDHEKETEAEEIERETEVLIKVEEVAEDGRENGGGRDGMIEDEHHESGNEIRAYGPKIIQVFQPNRVPHFLASWPRLIHWRHERSAVSSDYEVKFGKEDEIQERLRTGSHATILVLADTSNLTTVGMTFSFTGEEE